jgi:hypothetical protein
MWQEQPTRWGRTKLATGLGWPALDSTTKTSEMNEMSEMNKICKKGEKVERVK